MQLVETKPHIASQTDRIIMFLELNEGDTAKYCENFERFTGLVS